MSDKDKLTDREVIAFMIWYDNQEYYLNGLKGLGEIKISGRYYSDIQALKYWKKNDR